MSKRYLEWLDITHDANTRAEIAAQESQACLMRVEGFGFCHDGVQCDTIEIQLAYKDLTES